MTTITKALMTADELLVMPSDGNRYELIKGELRKMSPAGSQHGIDAMEFAGLLFYHVKKHKLGKVFAAETGFKIATNPDTVIAPDAAFVRQELIDKIGIPKGYWPGAPDLAVEVVSPYDTKNEVKEKIEQWLNAGSRMVVAIYPKNRTLVVHRSLTDVVTLKGNDTFSADDIVPGFSCAVSEIFS
jgi:Uma2 family endonuclease